MRRFFVRAVSYFLAYVWGLWGTLCKFCGTPATFEVNYDLLLYLNPFESEEPAYFKIHVRIWFCPNKTCMLKVWSHALFVCTENIQISHDALELHQELEKKRSLAGRIWR